jgi:Protein of unknown function (DUF1592)/Protein of unknown function (DUF1588)/Protein of unknown function (DUF1587)/Protein of unknown function (DUF1585)/Protein of unknown function (DUF1595)/Planctomycete cytochrome C
MKDAVVVSAEIWDGATKGKGRFGRLRAGGAAAVGITFALFAIPAAYAADTTLDQQFEQTVRPFVTQYCTACHSGAKATAGLDLKTYTSMASAVEDHERWARVREKLMAKEMPPAAMPQPSTEARQKVADWIQAMRSTEARKHAGDPGRVLARRLSNAEYNYTIRDLTGVDLQPAREFPVDPANTSGFDNSGESLTMSPALLKKYLQGARDIGDHMVLTPDGINFAPFPMLVETDREKYAIQRIVNFYDRQPTDFADYFQAAWRFKYRAALGKPSATLAAVAAETKVSPKYLPLVWQALEQTKEEVGPLAKLQAMWRELPAPKDGQTQQVRDACARMRDFVVNIRVHTGMLFYSPTVPGLNANSQPLVNWKNEQWATHHRDFDRAALRVAGDPPPGPLVVTEGPAFSADKEVFKPAVEAWIKARREDPDLVIPTAAERPRYEAAFARFSNFFPDAFVIRERGRFYPVTALDKGRLLSAGLHNVMGYFRDDRLLSELILDENGHKELDKLWNEFDFIADYSTRTYLQFFYNNRGQGPVQHSDKDVTAAATIFGLRDSYLEKAAPANRPVAMQAIRDHFEKINSSIRAVEKMRAEGEAHHLDALTKFAERAYRRPLTQAEKDDLLGYYRSLRTKDGLTHEEAVRESVVSVLMTPEFCYRIDLDARAATGASRPLSLYALASRLSYFLWSSMPDAELLTHAAAGDLQRPDVLLAQTRRMLKDDRARGLATEFAGNWLDFRRFETHNSVDRERFPTFTPELREAMFQEPIRYTEDMIRSDRSVFDLLYGNYTFVNPVLAKHYGMPEVKGGDDTWVRVDDAARYQRGGLLPMAVFLTATSPGLRTSPVKRGYWMVHRVLGQVIPPPPPVVPELPNDEAKSDLPIREKLAQHRANPVCGSCHARFDVFGLAFEGYGPVGEARAKDLAGRPIDAKATFPGGSEGTGIDGVRTYIRENRQNQFLDGLERKLLVYALNRSLQLSDEPVIESMQAKMTANQYRFSSLVETIVTSPQFLNKRNPEISQNTVASPRKAN